MLTLSKLRVSWQYELYFLKMHICVYLSIKFQLSSVILTSFTSLPLPLPLLAIKQTPKKPIQIGVNREGQWGLEKWKKQVLY